MSERHRFTCRTGTFVQWAAVASSEIPALGEVCFESDTHAVKVGNGTDVYADLPYANINYESAIANHAALTTGVHGITNADAIWILNNLTKNTTDDTLDFPLGSTGVTMQIGQENFVKIYNDSLSTIQNGSAVYLSGAAGQRPIGKLARANSKATSNATIGIATMNIPSHTSGFVTVQGFVRDIPSYDLTEGDEVFLSDATAGAYTRVRPTKPSYIVSLGHCVRVAGPLATIYVEPRVMPDFNDLGDVNISTPTSGQILNYGGSGWRNSTYSPTITLSGGVSGSGTMTNLGSVSITTTNNGVTSLAGTTNQVNVSGATGAITLSAPQDIHTGASPTFAGLTADAVQIGVTAANQVDTSAGDLLVDSASGTTRLNDNVIVQGDLTVNGTTYTVEAQTITLADPVITLAKNTSVADTKDRGLEMKYFDSTVKLAFVGIDNTTKKLKFLIDATNTSEAFTGTKGTLDAKIEFADVQNVPSFFNKSTDTLDNITDGTTYKKAADATTYASESAMLTSGAKKGDIAVRSDLGKTYVLTTTDPTQLANWLEIKSAGGATGGPGNYAFFENDQHVTVDYTITSGKNAMTAGPIIVDTGITVTVPTGSVWSII